jgi:hypothetical protein
MIDQLGTVNETPSADSYSDVQGTGAGARVRTSANRVKAQASSLYGDASGRVQNLWSTARREASANPFAAVVGAAAVAAGIGWLLPSSKKEKRVMSQVATKVSDAAHEAANAAVEAGRKQAEDLTHNALASVGGAVVGAVLSGDQKTQ